MTSKDDEDGVNWVRQNNFNPFDYQASSTTRGTSMSSFTQPVSFRKMQMQQVFSELLDAAGSYRVDRHVNSKNDDDDDDEDILQSILLENKSVVLQPLEEDEVVLDADSVIRPGMTRSQRYKVYVESLETRIQAAKSRQVKAVLEAIRDFVERHE